MGVRLCIHLPNRVMAVGVAERTSEQVPVKWAAHISGDRMAEVLRFEIHGVIFVNRLAIDHRLYGVRS